MGAVMHKRLGAYNTLCGRNALRGTTYLTILATRKDSEVTCSRCLAKLAKAAGATPTTVPNR